VSEYGVNRIKTLVRQDETKISQVLELRFYFYKHCKINTIYDMGDKKIVSHLHENLDIVCLMFSVFIDFK
jgi:hypothetical protein